MWLCARVVCAGATMERFWKYYIARLRGGKYDGRWLFPMAHEHCPQWSDDDGHTFVHLYYGNTPGTAQDSARCWHLVEAKSGARPGAPSWEVMATRAS